MFYTKYKYDVIILAIFVRISERNLIFKGGVECHSKKPFLKIRQNVMLHS